MRLIETRAAEAQLLASIATAPAGQKLSIPRLRDTLLCQADVLNALSRLVAAGKLDRATLRPPVLTPKRKMPDGFRRGQSADGEFGAPLFEALVAEGRRRGLTVEQTSMAVWNNKARIYRLRTCDTVRKQTADSIRAWIADRQEPARERAEASGAVRTPEVGAVPPPASQGSAPKYSPLVQVGTILPEIRAFLKRTGMAESRFGKDVVGDGHFLARLGKSESVRAATVEKVRAFIANYTPPADPMPVARREEPAPVVAPRSTGAGSSSSPRADPTQPPTTPLMDAEERQRIAGKRQFAKARRAQEETAAAKLDAGKAPANSFERAAMNNIRTRREEEARQGDPVEQAKLALQRKGRVVHSATIHGGRRGYFHVGGQRDPRTGRLREISPAELLDLAEKATGQSFRRVA